MQGIHSHFSAIAQNYRNLRTTDLEPIFYIRDELQQLRKIEAADVGCGGGRYILKLFQNLGDKLYLYCIDNNNEMLEELKEYLTLHNIENFQPKNALAKNLPIQSKSIDCVFTFNAVHHFRILEFLNEVSRVLKDGGYLFIYTRLKSQNSRTIWGKYFPLFIQKETRLYEIDELESIIEEMPGLEIQNIEYFTYRRNSKLDWLVEQARNNHYSTFYLYHDGEFDRSLDTFKQNLQKNFRDSDNISWIDRNVLLVIRKCGNFRFPDMFI